MGGRGSSSGLSSSGSPQGNAGVGGSQGITDAKNLNELTRYMSSSYGVTLDSSLSGQDFELTKNSAAQVARIIDEVPQAAQCFKAIRGDDLPAGTYTRAKADTGEIITSNQKFASGSDIEQKYKADVIFGFHPEGTTYENIVTHEAGHILERALIEKAHPHQDGRSPLEEEHVKASEWDNYTQSKQLISEACKAAKKTPDGKGKTNRKLIESVSGYAKKNSGEALAECVADYVANRSKAKPLSKEVWKLLKDRLG